MNKATIIRLYAEGLRMAEINGSGSHIANKDYAFETTVRICMPTEALYYRYANWLARLDDRC